MLTPSWENRGLRPRQVQLAKTDNQVLRESTDSGTNRIFAIATPNNQPARAKSTRVFVKKGDKWVLVHANFERIHCQNNKTLKI
jgi:hypothetical protein